MAIDQVKVRAEITIGNLEVVTPFIQSFNVTKSRNQPSTFTASLKVASGEVGSTITGDNIVIKAGSKGNVREIFTGIVTQAKISPCWDDPHYVILSMSGGDALAILAGKKFTRRCRATRSAWVNIQGVVRKGLKSGRFGYVNSFPIVLEHGDQEGEKKVTRTRASSKAGTAKIPDISELRPIDAIIHILTNEKAGGA